MSLGRVIFHLRASKEPVSQEVLSYSVVRGKEVKWYLAPGCHEFLPAYTLPTLARSQHNLGMGLLFALLSKKLEGGASVESYG